MTLLNMTTASTASECCNACRVTELQVVHSTTMEFCFGTLDQQSSNNFKLPLACL